MAGWLSALQRTREALSGALAKVLGGGASVPDDEAIEALERALLQADVAPRLTAELLREVSRGGGAGRTRRERLAVHLIGLLLRKTVSYASGEKPKIVLVVGVNGAGKTTTCAKLAHNARKGGAKALLCAADTFRAAGSEQLRIWATRTGCEVVAGETGADAAAVAYDAVDAALARGSDVVFVDTAGRMHTKQPLMHELQKVKRAMAKRLPRAPDETWIVLDAALGRNALAQAKQFHEATPLTGVIISKLDGSSKAGFVFSIAQELGLPVLFAGLGEGADDLAPFDPEAFVKSLLDMDHEAAG